MTVEALLTIRGMSCQHCVKTVTEALRGLPGVEAVEVSLEAGTARIAYDPALSDRQAMARAVADAGYELVTGQ